MKTTTISRLKADLFDTSRKQQSYADSTSITRVPIISLLNQPSSLPLKINLNLSGRRSVTPIASDSHSSPLEESTQLIRNIINNNNNNSKNHSTNFERFSRFSRDSSTNNLYNSKTNNNNLLPPSQSSVTTTTTTKNDEKIIVS
jgi:hypothetical protein